jgi:DNA-binding winged helix-turn-helix (wHTH) protein/tetratricopeptide (TPR) repeat protein
MYEAPPRKPPPIDLAHQPDFSLGSLTVKASTREIIRADMSRDVLEPRVMQVLAALHHASPNVVSRDDLVAQCWEGRVVGDDAINAAIGKLRRLAETCQDFTIETVPRVGYRMVVPAQSGAPKQAAIADKSGHADSVHAGGSDRRALLGGGVALGAAAIAGGGWWFAAKKAIKRATKPPASSPQIASLIARGNEALRNGRLEAQTQAAGLFQEAINLAPDNGDAWGGLALADAFIAHNGSKEAYEAAHMRAQSALAKAMALDPRNAMAWQAKSWSYPWRDAYLEGEQAARQGLTFHPDDDGLLMVLTQRLQVVGRMRESVQVIKHAVTVVSGLNPAMAYISIASFAGAGQLVEADQAAAKGIAMFPRHPLTWLNRLFLLMFTGRAAEALVSLRDIDNRPAGVAEDDADGMIAVAQALVSGARRDIDKAASVQLARAKKGGRDAENALMYLAGMGKVDEAFAVAQTCYLYPAANIQPVRFVPYLFEPGCRAMRKDARFAGLMDQMGLTAYWHKVGVKPDYQLYGDG